MTSRIWLGKAALAVAFAMLAAGCGGGSSTTKAPASASSSPAAYSPSNQNTAEIAANWEAFFSGMTRAARKISLLENGRVFSEVIQAQASSPMAKGTEARVSAVQVSSPTTATVTYSILLSGQVMLADQTGQAVLEAGVWKVGDASFCALLALEGQTPPACPSAAASPSPVG